MGISLGNRAFTIVVVSRQGFTCEKLYGRHSVAAPLLVVVRSTFRPDASRPNGVATECHRYNLRAGSALIAASWPLR